MPFWPLSTGARGHPLALKRPLEAYNAYEVFFCSKRSDDLLSVNILLKSLLNPGTFPDNRMSAHPSFTSPTESRPLDTLAIGDTGVVRRLVAGADIELRNKLLAMGIVKGARVEVLHRAPLGDPMSIRVLDFQLSLRHSEASHVIVD